MVEHTLQTVHDSLIQGYCATADCATGDCARLLGLCCTEFGVLEFRSEVQQTQVKGFSEVIDQHPGTPSVPSTCRRTKQMEFQSSDPRRVDQSMEYKSRRLDGVRVRGGGGEEID